MGSLLRGALVLIAVLVAVGCTDLLPTAQCMGAAAGGEILSRRSLAAAHAGSSMYSSNMARKLAGRHESKSNKNQQVCCTYTLKPDLVLGGDSDRKLEKIVAAACGNKVWTWIA